MGTSPAVQVDPSSIDTLGVSVATSPASASNSRLGSAYNPTTLAGLGPVWVHPTYSGRVLVVSARRWYAGTPLGGTPGAYSAHSTDMAPSWVLLDGPTGHTLSVPGQTLEVPMLTSASGVALVGAASRPPALLFLLSSATVAGVATAVLQRFSLGLNGSVALVAEDVLPVSGTVVFNKGLQYDGPNLVVYGTDSSHRLYKVTKPWGHVGVDKATTVPIVKYSNSTTQGTPLGWQYYTGTGYSADVAELAPLLTSTGAAWTTQGPMSFGWWRNLRFATTVVLTGSTYTGQVWISRSGQPWVPLAAPIVALGSSADGSYIGAGIQLQQQLAPNPAATAMTAAGVKAGIPYVSWSKVAASTGFILDTLWSILPVTG